MDRNEITCISLCSGYEGIGLGLKRVLPNLRTIAYAEIEEYACAVLAARMEEGKLDVAPIWTDVKTFPGEDFYGKVHILTSGFPCQPFSVAGKRLGSKDPRHLWPHIARIIKAVRPVWCIFENVENHLNIGYPTVYASLRDMGYNVEAELVAASDVGAPHRRKRLFIMAHNNKSGLEGKERGQSQRIRGGLERCGQLENSGSGPGGNQDGQADRRDRQENVPQGNGQAGTVRAGAAGQLADNSGAELQGRQSESGNDEQERQAVAGSRDKWPARPREQQYEWEEPRVIMSRADSTFLKGYVEKYQTAITEGQVEALAYAVDKYAIEPVMGRAVDESRIRVDAVANRVDRLRLLGNGVVPAQAEKAIRLLWQKIDTNNEK